MKKNHPEHREQVEFFEWFKEHYPLIVAFAIPNGGYRAIHEAVELKKEGVLPGIPDIMIADGNPGLYIEMKIKPNKPSDEQIKILKALKEAGYSVVVAYSAEEAKQAVQFYLRERGTKFQKYDRIEEHKPYRGF